ncbi:MAG: sulfotransferase family 2 domain-containing protein [Planctomycetota bacterium]
MSTHRESPASSSSPVMSFAPGDGDTEHYPVPCVALREYRLIFVMIPKAGCTSILAAIAHILGVGDSFVSDRHLHTRFNRLFQSDRSSVYQTVEEALAACPGFTAVAFVRDPAARAVSAHASKVSSDGDGDVFVLRRHRGEIWRGMTLLEMLDAVRRIPVRTLDKHYRPQWTFLRAGVEVVGRVESLADDWQRLTDRFNLPKVPLGHRNRSAPATRRASLAPDEARLITDMYRDDFERLGYTPPETTAPEAASPDGRTAARPCVVVGARGSGVQRVCRTLDGLLPSVSVLQDARGLAALDSTGDNAPAIVAVVPEPELAILLHARGVGAASFENICRQHARWSRALDVALRNVRRPFVIRPVRYFADPDRSAWLVARRFGLDGSVEGGLREAIARHSPPWVAAGADAAVLRLRSERSANELQTLDTVAHRVRAHLQRFLGAPDRDG